ncbi:hypothetical protein BC937DRAFT_89848 [Endogone sp. FLAS-F59071]|nr:hypothetical protein BC937DRAFT_89848 [Endogone sp. FLAS-F59071]|eukprot:RUS22273.1 hypothetical protein BC937DRAFT_89848 [Endogone sp. FLAS-F59071]
MAGVYHVLPATSDSDGSLYETGRSYTNVCILLGLTGHGIIISPVIRGYPVLSTVRPKTGIRKRDRAS